MSLSGAEVISDLFHRLICIWVILISTISDLKCTSSGPSLTVFITSLFPSHYHVFWASTTPENPDKDPPASHCRSRDAE
jgi:hypothetical protein